MKIEDILKNKKETGKKKKAYTLQKSTFTIADQNKSKKDGGRTSVGKTDGSPVKPKLNINDPEFWEKVLPFDGFNPKQLSRKFRAKRNDIFKNKENQSKFLKEVTKCVDDILESKTINPTVEIDEEIYDLLKRMVKTKQFEHKYRTKSTMLLDKMLHFNDYRMLDGDDGGRLQRKAKQKPKDYKEKSNIGEKRKKKSDGRRSGSHCDDLDSNMASDSHAEEKVSEKRDSEPPKKAKS